MKKKITNWLPMKWQRTTKALGISLALVGLSNVSSGQCNWPTSGVSLFGTGTANNTTCVPVTATDFTTCHYFSEYALFNGLVVGQSYTITVTNTDAASPAGPYTLGVYTATTAGTAPLTSATNATFPISVTFVATSTTVYSKSYTASCGSTGNNCNYFTIQNTTAPTAAPTTNQPSTATVASGSSNVQVLRLDVSTCAASALTDITFGTTGSTNPITDISAAKVYYTTSATFSTTTQFGTTVANPNGTFTVSGSQTIPTGVGYFWLVYDLACGAVATDLLDAEVITYTLAGTPVALTGTTSNPTGTRTITAATAAAATRSDGNSTTAVAAGSVNAPFVYTNVNACGVVSQVDFSVIGTSTSTDISQAKCYYSTSSTFNAATAIPFGTPVANPAAGTVSFSGSQSILTGNNYFWMVYDVACAATAANTLNANVTSVTVNGGPLSPTGTAPSANAITALYLTSRTDGNSTTAVTAGTLNAPFVYSNVTGSTLCPGTVTQVNFDVTAGAAVGNIAQAKCYYTTTSTFATTTPFGSPVVNPATGALSFSGTQALATGSNYFWMVYDVACTAVGGNTLNGNITSVVVNGATITPTGTAPSANTITAIGLATRTDANGTTALSGAVTDAPFVYTNISSSANCPSTVTQVDFAVTASAGDVAQAKCYYTTTSTFNTATPFGSPIANPVTGIISFSGTQTLAGGSNYFWMVYDIACSAAPGNTINGDIVSLTVNSSTVTPTGTATAANAIASSANTVADGEWSNPTTWACGNVPASTTPVVINHNVTVASSGNVSGNITIASGKSLTVSSGDLTMGPIGGGNRVFTNNGTLNVNGGTINLNGNMAIPSGATFSQSGGNINVDGNAAGVLANSVPTGRYLVNIASQNLTLTGGTITIVDPHAGTSSTDYSLYYSNSTANIEVGSGHTFQFGNGTSTDAGGSTIGFLVNNYVSSNRINLSNVVINGPASGNRMVTSTYSFPVKGNLTITNNGHLSIGSTTVGGDLTVNTGSTLTSTGTVTFAAFSGTSTTSAVTIPQTISGEGTFRNNNTPTANFTSLTINNTSSTGLTFANTNTLLSGTNTGTVSGTLTMTAGMINVGANTLVLGTSPTSAGTYTYTAGMIIGKFKRFITAATGSRAFNIGTPTGAKTATINFTAAPTTAGSLTAEWVSAPSGNNGLPIMEGVNEFTQASSLGYWTVSAGNGLAGGTYTATFNGVGLADVSDYNSLTVGKRSDASAPWALDGTYVAPTGSNANFVISRTGIASGFSDFGIIGGATALPVKLASFTGKNAGAINTLHWKTTEEKNFSHFELQRSKDGANFHKLAVVSSNRNAMGSDYAYNDERPFEGKNFYRLNMVDVDGRSVLSEVVELMVKAGTGLSVNVYPNPVSQQLNIEVAGKIDGNAKVIVTDMVGKTVRTIAMTGNTAVVDMNNLPSGIYMIKYSDNSQSSVIKVTKD